MQRSAILPTTALALSVALLHGCAAAPPQGAVVELYREAMAAAAERARADADGDAPRAARAVGAVVAWRRESADAAD